MSLRLSTTSTTPLASTGLMICHDPICASARSTGSSARSICDSGAAAVPRTISSLKSPLTWPSTHSLSPMVPAVGCRVSMNRCDVSPSPFCTRSTMALACSAHPSPAPPRCALATTERHSLRQISSSLLEPEDMHRFSSIRPVILSTSAGARVPMELRDASTTERAALSKARSRYRMSFRREFSAPWGFDQFHSSRRASIIASRLARGSLRSRNWRAAASSSRMRGVATSVMGGTLISLPLHASWW
mmetsp:Transcript_36028/g.88768  ORF Transcript_36028/g.88768 Transcript_36028/m.88768 type:complete len:246 (+) Transcript_36028:686-1423(+)